MKALQANDGKGKLYTVIKALSAMRLTKEDGYPDAILARKNTQEAG